MNASSLHRVSSLLSAAGANKAMAFIVTGGVLLVVILLARAVGRLAGVAAAPVPVPKPSGGVAGKLLLAVAAGAGAWFWYASAHHAPAAVRSAPAPVPVPVPRPAVTLTVTPHAAVHAHPWLTGGDLVAIYVVVGVVVIVLVSQILGRSS